MAAVLLVIADVHLDVVLHTAGAPLFIGGGLDGDRGWCLFRHLEGEWVRVGTQLLDKPLLQLCSFLILGWVDLLRSKVQILLEVEAHHLIFLTAIPKAAHELPKHPPVVEVRRVHHKHAIWEREKEAMSRTDKAWCMNTNLHVR